MKPTIGRVVHVLWKDGVAPALITRVFSNEMVNLRLFPDGSNEVPALTSISLHEDEASARAVAQLTGFETRAFWPARG